MKYSNNTKLVIVSPCYNEEKITAESAARLDCVIGDLIAKDKISSESIVLFVNDGSTDSTQDVIDWYSQNYPNVISIQKENGGVADARNTGIKEANGNYIAFMDNDDMIRPEMISLQIGRAHV